MKQLLTVLHAEDRLSPSALSIVKGGVDVVITCRINNCGTHTGSCGVNTCTINDATSCIENTCGTNCRSHCGSNCSSHLISGENPGHTCPTAR